MDLTKVLNPYKKKKKKKFYMMDYLFIYFFNALWQHG